MKICKHCLTQKPLSSFKTYKGKKNNHYLCEECIRKYNRDYWAKKKKHLSKKKKENALKLKERNKLYVIDFLKKSKCVDCSIDNLLVLEFDHIKEKKLYNISEMVSNCSLETLKKEIEKCEVVCANCHRIRTAKMFGYFKTFHI